MTDTTHEETQAGSEDHVEEVEQGEAQAETQQGEQSHEEQSGDDSNDLQKELERLRKENGSLRSEAAKHRVSRNEERNKAKTLEERLEDLERLRKEDEIALHRERVAGRFSIPEDLKSMLGNDPDSMETNAQRLVEFRQANPPRKQSAPSPSPRGGADPNGGQESVDIAALAQKLRR